MPSLPRRRGAQPGNTNALKHGFYTRRFTKRDLSGVETTNLKNLAEEIALIRVFTRRMVETAVQEPDYYDLVSVLRAICLASGTITRIIKAQTFINADTNEWSASIDEAIRLVSHEFGIDKSYPPSPENLTPPE
jgi:hypothetical protein